MSASVQNCIDPSRFLRRIISKNIWIKLRESRVELKRSTENGGQNEDDDDDCHDNTKAATLINYTTGILLLFLFLLFVVGRRRGQWTDRIVGDIAIAAASAATVVAVVIIAGRRRWCCCLVVDDRSIVLLAHGRWGRITAQSFQWICHRQIRFNLHYVVVGTQFLQRSFQFLNFPFLATIFQKKKVV